MSETAITSQLDGSFIPRFRKQFARRLSEIIEYASSCRRDGLGVLSLPEFDIALANLIELHKELAPHEPPPELAASNPAAWPKYSSSGRNKLKRAVELGARFLCDEARKVVQLAPPCLGTFPENTGWTRDSYSPTKYFLNAAYRGTDNSLQRLPILDRIFGRSVDDLLRSLLAFNRFDTELSTLSGHTSYFDHVFTGLLLGNSRHLAVWAQKEFPPRALPTMVRNACNILRLWILNPEQTFKPIKCSSKTQFDVAVYQTFVGIACKDVDLINTGVRGLFKTWPRVEIAVWDGRSLPPINIPAIAVIKTAIRLGLKPAIPDCEGNDHELVVAPDPVESIARFALYPGLMLMIQNPDVMPATLFTNIRETKPSIV